MWMPAPDWYSERGWRCTHTGTLCAISRRQSFKELRGPPVGVGGLVLPVPVLLKKGKATCNFLSSLVQVKLPVHQI